MNQPIIKQLGLQEYLVTWQNMRAFTDARHADTADEIWLVEHPPVFTLGQKGERQHILTHTVIPIIHTDRGGQVTYHGPGQLVVYLLVNLKRLNLGIKRFVYCLEQAIIDLLIHDYKIKAERKEGAPGVYVKDAKICSLGLRVRRGFTYHGLAFNLAMDLTPFTFINPCGYAGLRVTQLSELTKQPLDKKVVANRLIKYIIQQLGYPNIVNEKDYEPN